MSICFHCGNNIIETELILFEAKKFCCNGCKTVYEIFSSNGLNCYYDFEKNPGSSPIEINGKYDFLENSEIVSKLIDFEEDNLSIVRLNVPNIHCSSCIWILENLNKLNEGVSLSQVNFSQKKVVINFNPKQTNLKEVVLLLSSIGYEPYISLENFDAKPKLIDRSLIFKIGVAFFGFGNIMLLSFPEYFNVDDYWMREYKMFFRYVILLISLPVFFYSATPYYISAWNSIKLKKFNIDIPMALGIIVMFVRSLVDIFFQDGQGFLDSMCGLVFFMLSGKLIQLSTFNFLSFERDYKSYFPIAVTKLEDDKEMPIQVYEIEKQNKLLIRNQELIPVDSILISEHAYIDYSFVSGEAIPVEKKSGDKIFAGGKQMGEAIVIESIKTVSQSYLTQLWSNDVFQKKNDFKFRSITDRASQLFTPALLFIAFVGLFSWGFYNWNIAFNVFTAVLIVACPCALALTAPYTWGNVIRILGKKKFYLKNTIVIEQLSNIDAIVFDKTGTITSSDTNNIEYKGDKLTSTELLVLRNLVRGSNHPLSRRLYNFLPEGKITKPDMFEEIAGAGIVGVIQSQTFKIGSAKLMGLENDFKSIKETRVYVMINDVQKGYFVFENQYREGLSMLFKKLIEKKYKLFVLSGDNDGERKNLERLLPNDVQLVFNQKPDQKLEFIKNLQEKGLNVMMVGDGLNDAGALAQSNVGISISENVNVFTPASDAILDASSFSKLQYFLEYTKKSMSIIKMSYALALTYNVIGISFALSNNLSPLVAAIIMPVSTATIIGFVTIMAHFYARDKS